MLDFLYNIDGDKQGIRVVGSPQLSVIVLPFGREKGLVSPSPPLVVLFCICIFSYFSVVTITYCIICVVYLDILLSFFAFLSCLDHTLFQLRVYLKPPLYLHKGLCISNHPQSPLVGLPQVCCYWKQWQFTWNSLLINVFPERSQISFLKSLSVHSHQPVILLHNDLLGYFFLKYHGYQSYYCAKFSQILSDPSSSFPCLSFFNGKGPKLPLNYLKWSTCTLRFFFVSKIPPPI